MKKLSLSILALCCTLLATAEPIGKQAALYTARSFMIKKGKNVVTPSKSSRNKASNTEEDYYYVFNSDDGNGYVIVSGDDRIDPIIGYVDHGTFDPDNIPENMRAYLDSFTEEIKYVIDNDLQPTSPQLKRSNKVQYTKHSIPELLTCRWNQNLPYNLTLDYYWKEDGTQARPATGCIATAWAQVVYFHKWPDAIKVKIPSYSKTYTLSDGTTKTVTYPEIPKGTKIDWEHMQDTYSCSEDHAHTTADTAVANLMYYVGKAVKMSYGGSSSASYHTGEFIQYFGYDDCASRISRDDYDIDGWVDVIYNELAEGYPIPMAGTKITGAHAFVVDGFDGDELFHVNWGWGGTGNGWFLLGILNRWNRGNGAIIKLRRPGTDTPKDEIHLNIKDVSIVNNISIRATFENKTGASGNFYTAIVKPEDDGSYSIVGTKQSITGMAADASATKTFQIKNKLTAGTYKLSPASKTARGTIWTPYYNLKDQYIEAVVDSTGAFSMRIVSPVTNISVESISFPRMRIVGEEQEIDVTFRNDGDEFYHDVHLFASKTQSKVYTDYMFRVYAHKGETVTFPFYYTPTETGTYNLWFCTEKNGNGEIGQGTMEIITAEEAEANRANLAITHTVVNGSGNVAYGNRLYGKASVKNNGSKDFHGNIELQLWHQKKTASSAVSGPSQSFKLDITAGKTETLDYEFDNLSNEYYYRFKSLYKEQSGNLSGGGLWDVKIDMQNGYLTWKSDGTVTGKTAGSSISILSTVCGVYANTSTRITRMTPNSNPNTIYAYAQNMELPASLSNSNAVCGNHADHINLVNDQPYYLPASFVADSASFTYTFAENEDGTKWHAFTMPFSVDSISIDDFDIQLGDTLNHFWIYEFAAEGDDGEVIFEPTTYLRRGTPYIIAADANMAGRSIVFHAFNAPFYKMGSNKMLVSTSDYHFYGNTCSPKIKDCYMLNADGTAFEYVTTTKAVPAMEPYFTTNLPEDLRPESIVLPEIPVNNNEDPTGIYNIRGYQNRYIYNLAGQRLSKPVKGINIINGKKILR